MPHINVDFSDVPDEILPIPPGVYEVEVKKVDVKPSKDGMSQVLWIEMEIVTEGPVKGRMVRDWIGVKAKTSLKRFALSCGLTPGPEGINTEDTLGRHARVEITKRVYTDTESGEQRDTHNVRGYLIEQKAAE